MTSSRSDAHADVAVVGAGPAGIAAAVAAADAGLTVAVLDLGERIGGQYYRHAASQATAAEGGPFHHGWGAFVALRDRFTAAAGITHLPRSAVWSIEQMEQQQFVVRAAEGERERRPRTATARALIIATGAHDRHLPFPGWTLPGVMAGGGAQGLLKGSHVSAGRRAVVAGTGPFLLAVADGLLAAGTKVAGVVEANAPWQFARHPRALAAAQQKLPEALGYAARLARHRVRYRTRHAVIRAHGEDRLEAVTVAALRPDWRPIPGTERRVDCDLLAVGYGFTPQIELLISLGCAAQLQPDDSLAIAADYQGRTSVANVYAAGETTGVGGADLAIIEGTLSGAAAARDLQGAPSNTASKQLHQRAQRLRRFATAMHNVHRIGDGWTTWLTDETIVCRCEEVPYRIVKNAVTELGATDARTVKLLARPGMGWCQGRICGNAVAAMTAQLTGAHTTPQQLQSRPLAQPVPLSMLAELMNPPSA